MACAIATSSTTQEQNRVCQGVTPSAVSVPPIANRVTGKFTGIVTGIVTGTNLDVAEVTLVNLLFLPALRQKTRSLIVRGTENQGFLVETFRGAMILKTTQATPQAWQEYQSNYGRLTSLGWSTMKLGLCSSTITGILSSFTSIALLWLGSYLVIDRTLLIGQLLASNGMSGNFLGFLGAVIGLIDEFIMAQVVIQPPSLLFTK